jgi:hypothetical protein
MEFRTLSTRIDDGRIGIVRNRYENDNGTWLVLAWFDDKSTPHSETVLEKDTVEVSPEELCELATVSYNAFLKSSISFKKRLHK